MNYQFVFVLMFKLSYNMVFTQPLCFLDSSDLADIVNTPCFIDKSLLVKDILEGPRVILLTSPRCFGKSTNLNMLKRFLEIIVESDGNRKKISETQNYNIFQNHNLSISGLVTFFNDHFGKYPVIFIDYKPLERVTTFESMLEFLRQVLLNTFEEHMYLIENSELWTGDSIKEEFMKFIHPMYNKDLKTAEIKTGFTLLAKLLYNNFQKKVIVLVDAYDSFIETLLFKNNPDTELIITYVKSVNVDLINSQEYVTKVVISGVLRVQDATVGGHLEDCYFLGGHRFTQYYGLTCEEVNKIVKRLANHANVSEERSKIKQYYGGYNVINKDLNIYSTWSILNYLYRDNEVNFYRRRKGYLNIFQYVMNLPEISHKVQLILSNKPVYLNISNSFSLSDILSLNNLISSGKVKNEETTDLFLHYLYQIGYFSFSKGTNYSEDVFLTVPNKEVYLELKCLLRKTS